MSEKSSVNSSLDGPELAQLDAVSKSCQVVSLQIRHTINTVLPGI